MPDNFADRLYDDLLPLMRTGEYGFMVTVSRRTPEHVYDSFRNYFDGDNTVFMTEKVKTPITLFGPCELYLGDRGQYIHVVRCLNNRKANLSP